MRPMMLRMTDANTRVVAAMPRLADCSTKKPAFGKLQRSQKVVFHAAVGQFHDDVCQGIAMLRAVFRFFESGEDCDGLRAEAL
jgi:hypothetical protein